MELDSVIESIAKECQNFVMIDSLYFVQQGICVFEMEEGNSKLK